VARARNVTHYYELRNLGVELIERETLDAALMSGRSVLELLGFERHQARTLALRFRKHNVEQLEVMRPHFGDEAKLIAIAKQGRQQLEELFAQEREAALQRSARAGWGGQDSPPRDEDRPPAT
jgi:glutathione-regulated potassium-efflux system ancillary protein KefC